MKTKLLILSFVAAAFLAACSEGKTRIPTKTGGGQKTTEQLEKASSDDELKKLKAQLEQNKNVQIPDIITAVKHTFGRGMGAKEQPRQARKNKDNIPDQEPTQTPEKLTKQPSFDSVEMIDTDSDASKIVPNVVKNEESKHICIQTCEKQIIILRRKNDAGKVISVSAFVAAEISGANAEILTKSTKTLKSISVGFDLASDRMALKFAMTNNKKDVLYVTQDAPVIQKDFSGLKFSDTAGEDEGLLDYSKVNENKILRMTFENDKEVIKIKLKNDLGVFGKNKTAGDAKAEETQSTDSRF